MKTMPSKCKSGRAREVGVKVIEIAELRRTAPTPGDVAEIAKCLDRPGGDATPVEPVIESDVDYPKKKILIPEFEVLKNGREEVLKDISAGDYPFPEYLALSTKLILDFAKASAASGGAIWPRSSADVADLEIFLKTIPGGDPDAALPPEEFFEFLVGDYVCKQCY